MTSIAELLKHDRRRASDCLVRRYTFSEIFEMSIAEVHDLTREKLIWLIPAADVPLLREETIEYLKQANVC